MEEDYFMAMTMTQKILAADAGLREVSAGQLIQAKLNTTGWSYWMFPPTRS